MCVRVRYVRARVCGDGGCSRILLKEVVRIPAEVTGACDAVAPSKFSMTDRFELFPHEVRARERPHLMIAPPPGVLAGIALRTPACASLHTNWSSCVTRAFLSICIRACPRVPAGCASERVCPRKCMPEYACPCVLRMCGRPVCACPRMRVHVSRLLRPAALHL
jgi:hypothetical protein